MMAQQAQMGQQDPYGLGSIVTAAPAPPRPLGLITPRTPPRGSASFLWKAQPESVAEPRPRTPTTGGVNSSSGSRSPRASSFALPPPADDPRRTPTMSRPSTPPFEPASPRLAASPTDPSLNISSFIRLRSPPSTPPVSMADASPRLDDRVDDAPALQLRQPLQAPPQDTTMSQADSRSEIVQVSMVRPTFVHHDSEMNADDVYGHFTPAPESIRPRLTKPDFYSTPSVEKMKSMTEAQLSQIDNLEVGRLGFGRITWPGLTDVRRVDFDTAVSIERGSVALYPDSERPPVGRGLNKEAVIQLNVKPTRTGDGGPKDVSRWQHRMKDITEAAGNTFISYDLEVWMFKVPHFEVRER
eukprot:gnl/MRDRNA2_/MRDRNA2_15194_c0_seq1.p1 gnl/MRDRNA2_/MRDRNA2_15194_c0~~gnl/MRDRNA2_/MRDRNA2_15194_c0_seq1.p1  ORF type:complete len:408 (+),score=59.94 gnl/MRDRNA2_/MRDRNA2_15194_c0_seq1:157-1224(+)